MTELEKMQRAKLYIDKLAQGVNPLDDSVVPDSEVINQVRISRCLFYVSELLNQVIAREKRTTLRKSAKPAKRPFSLPLEQRMCFPYSEAPVSISEITRLLNQLIDKETMVSLSYRTLTSWLLSLGMLTRIEEPQGKYALRPTPSGEELGISAVQRTGSRGDYIVVVYDQAAQHFVVENLDAALAASQPQQDAEVLQGTPWLPAHDDCLRDLCQKKVPLAEIAITLKRSPSAVQSRAKLFGFTVT